jgi:hypothetical protein
VMAQPQTKVETLGLQVAESRIIQEETSTPMRTATHHAVAGGGGGVGVGWVCGWGESLAAASRACRLSRPRHTETGITHPPPIIGLNYRRVSPVPPLAFWLVNGPGLW